MNRSRALVRLVLGLGLAGWALLAACTPENESPPSPDADAQPAEENAGHTVER